MTAPAEEILVADVGVSVLSDPQDATIDIVFVHGLQGHPRATWTSKSSTSNSQPSPAPAPSSNTVGSDGRQTRTRSRIMLKRKRSTSGTTSNKGSSQAPNAAGEMEANVYWPRDLLAADFPTARIMTFGYDTTVTRGYQAVNQGNIFTHARNLLYAMESKRRRATDRGLVFIAHSLGGILVKEALRRSEADPDSRIGKIYASTRGIFFFGTPHRGSKDWASFGGGIADVAGRLLGLDTNDQVIHALLPTAPELEICRESFTSQWVKRGDTLMVRTFQESKGLTGVRIGGLNSLVVPPDSSTLDHPNQRARTINEDHMGIVKFSSRNDSTYQMVRDDLEELIERSMQELGNSAKGGASVGIEAKLSRASVYYIPFARNRRFIGRSTILHQLRQNLLIDKTCQSMAVVGLGGIGKTQVALKFAQLVKNEAPDYSIFWVPALSVESFEQAYGEIARLLDIGEAQEGQDVKELVMRYLSSQGAGKWLLIIDNADNVDVFSSSKGISDFLPHSDDGITLFTTRHSDVAQSLVGSDVLELDKMTEAEASDFLCKSLLPRGPIDGQPVQELIERLDYLPLAISQAAAYINTRKISISKYLELMTNTDADLLVLMSHEFRDNTRYINAANAVAMTWVVSFNQMLTENKDAVELLAFMSCIEWKAIPHSILPPLKPAARMDAAIGTICSYSFMTRQEDEETYNMHRLVHLALRTWLRNAGRDSEAKTKAVHHVAEVFPTRDWEKRMVWRAYLPHALQLDVIDLDDCTAKKQELRLRIGRCFWVDGRRQEAAAWLRKSYEWREKNLAPKDHDRLTSQLCLADTLMYTAQIEEAVSLLEHVVGIREKVLAEDDGDRLESQYTLARAYIFNVQAKDAIPLLKHVVRVQEKLPKDHLHRLASQHTLANAYQANGQAKDAILLLEYVVRVQEKLPEDHPHRLASQYTLAQAYHANRQVKDAIPLLEHVVRVREKLPEDHPARLVSQHALAEAYHANRQVEDAIPLLEHVVRVEEKLQEDHPDRLASQHALAEAYRANGQVEDAIPLLKHVVKMREKLQEDHPNRLSSQHALAQAYRANGQAKDAIPLLEYVVRLQEKLQEDHPYRLGSQHNLALAYRDNGECVKAIALMEHVVAIKKTSLAEDHPERLKSEEWLAYMYEADGQVGRALELMQHSVDVRRRTLAEDYPDQSRAEEHLALWRQRYAVDEPP